MIIAKEENGFLYLADLGPARSPFAPGEIVKPWEPLGPGTKPTVAMAGTKFYIAFEYLGHTYVREMDATEWPPEAIDPTTYTPNIALEEPHDAVGLGGSSPADGLAHDSAYDARPVPVLLERVTPNIIFDLDTLQGSLTLQRKASVAAPGSVPADRWRVYRRTPALDGNPPGAWELLMDWQAEIGPFTVIRDMSAGQFQEELAITFGYLWDPTIPNADPAVSGNYMESNKGPSLLVDSVVEPKTLQKGFDERVSAAEGPHAPGAVLFGGSQEFFSLPFYETTEVSGQHSPGAVVMVEPVSRGFVVPDFANPGTLADFFTLSQGVSPSNVLPYT